MTAEKKYRMGDNGKECDHDEMHTVIADQIKTARYKFYFFWIKNEMLEAILGSNRV